MLRERLFEFLLAYCLDSISKADRKMTNNANAGFKRRRNRDGKYDSICLCCFHTVGTAAIEEALESKEGSHNCSEQDLRQYRRLTAKYIGWLDRSDSDGQT